SQHYQMAPLVLESTDMVMTVNERFARRHNLHWVELPIDDIPPIQTHLFWHESTDQDPANRWMREQIIELSQQLERKMAKEREAEAEAGALPTNRPYSRGGSASGTGANCPAQRSRYRSSKRRGSPWRTRSESPRARAARRVGELHAEWWEIP